MFGKKKKKKKKQALVFLTLALLSLSLFSPAYGAVLSNGSITNYTQYSEDRFSFLYPKGWEIKAYDPQKLFYRYSPTKIYNRSTLISSGINKSNEENTIFQILTNTTYLPLNDFVNMTIAQDYSTFKGLIPISASISKIGNWQGTLFEYQYITNSGDRRRGTDFITIIPDKANIYRISYIIRYSGSYKNYLEILPAIKNFYTSFKFF